MSWRKVTGKFNFNALSSEERKSFALKCCPSVVGFFFFFRFSGISLKTLNQLIEAFNGKVTPSRFFVLILETSDCHFFANGPRPI